VKEALLRGTRAILKTQGLIFHSQKKGEGGRKHLGARGGAIAIWGEPTTFSREKEASTLL